MSTPEHPSPATGKPADAAVDKNNYRATLNLPKTSFPMKANLVQNEPASMKRWQQARLYERLREDNQRRRAEGRGRPRFVFHDGPPYANGLLHIGHLMNRCLKDFVVRTRSAMGFDCPFIPGWDCHGLPIEHKVVTDLIAAGKFDKLNGLPEDQRRLAVRRECQKHAEKFVKAQMTQMQRLLTTGDYEHPYLTMSKDFEAATLEVLADLMEQGLVYRALKPVHWSIANETALAEAELEYEDRTDPSVYVDFEAADAAAVYDAFGLPPHADDDESEDGSAADGDNDGADDARAEAVGEPAGERLENPLGPDRDDAEGSGPPRGRPMQTPSFMIWTTTPWTLPANLAIAVNPKFVYALVWIDGNVSVLAADAVERVTKAAKSQSVHVLATAAGEKLLGLRYRHPFLGGPTLRVGSSSSDGDQRGRDNPPRSDGLSQEPTRSVGPPKTDDSRVFTLVPADYVTLEDGTGLVHTAPGHGTEDYQTGLREGLPIYCPVQANGTYDATVPDWLRGVDIWKANEQIVRHLRQSGHMFFDHPFTHSYPHDWRSKTPVIFRCTEQWFVSVDRETSRDRQSLRALSLGSVNEENRDRVRFVPEWGRNRMRGMLESRPDWCISRQRSWGLPIPAFFVAGADGSAVFMTPTSIRAVAKVVREKGSDAWFTAPPADLLKEYDPAADPACSPSVAASLRRSVADLKKGPDILDVWFESGSTWNAVMRQRGVALGSPPLRGGSSSSSSSSSCPLRSTAPATANEEPPRSGGLPAAEEPMRSGGLPEDPTRSVGPPRANAWTDLYLEGSDQHRGWFQSSLLTCLGATGRPPYATLLTHGFMVDKDGRKMSKSEGNTLEVDDLLKEYGADVCRWWVASLSYENDVKVDKSYFDVAGESYRKVRNTLRFMLSNLDDFPPPAQVEDVIASLRGSWVPRHSVSGSSPVLPSSPPAASNNKDRHGVSGDPGPAGSGEVPAASPTSLEAWVLAEFDALSAACRDAFLAYDFQSFHKAVYDFCNHTLSSVYLAAVKDRLYCDRPDSPRRRRTQAALFVLTDGLCRLVAPVLCHTADEAYRALWKTPADDTTRCVHLETMLGADRPDAPAIGVRADPGWAVVMAARTAAQVALDHAKRHAGGVENPLDAGVVFPDPGGSLARFAKANPAALVDLADLVGVSRASIEPPPAGSAAGGAAAVGEVRVIDLRAEPRCERSWKRDGTVRPRSDGGQLSDRDAAAVGVA